MDFAKVPKRFFDETTTHHQKTILGTIFTPIQSIPLTFHQIKTEKQHGHPNNIAKKAAKLAQCRYIGIGWPHEAAASTILS
ncbi:MAG: hypothetical protein IPN76_05510 [Saprospiraceae bacterium]|nr:hypothetical protein [Saprospiraceae bacterium]